MRPDLVAEERQPISDARPPRHLRLVPFEGGLHDSAGATRRPPQLVRAAKVMGRMTLAVLAGAVCLLMLLGVVINLLGATP